MRTYNTGVESTVLLDIQLLLDVGEVLSEFISSGVSA
jgi:hypothetical protein